MYRIAIADDEKIHLINLKRQVLNILNERIQSLTEFTSADDLVDYIEKKGFPFDIVILDIDFSESRPNGIDMAKSIRAISSECQIIFCTGYLSYATDVYDVDHTYFVLKTDIEKRLPEALRRAEQMLSELRSKMLYISVKGRDIVIDQNDILYLERMQRITQINLANDIISCYEPIESLLSRMSPVSFVQCHKSYAVNLSKIRVYRKNSLTLLNNKIIPVSRANVQMMHDAFMSYVDCRI